MGFVTLYVNDVDRAKQFYTQTLGFETRIDEPMPEGGRWVMLAPPGAQTSLALHGPGSMGWSVDYVGGFTGHGFEVDDVFATHAKLAAAGVAFPEPPSMMFFGGWAQFKDSEGNIFGLHSPAPAELAHANS